MSATHDDGSFDSGRNHLKPVLIAVVLTAVIVILTVALSGMPH